MLFQWCLMSLRLIYLIICHIVQVNHFSTTPIFSLWLCKKSRGIENTAWRRSKPCCCPSSRLSKETVWSTEAFMWHVSQTAYYSNVRSCSYTETTSECYHQFNIFLSSSLVCKDHLWHLHVTLFTLWGATIILLVVCVGQFSSSNHHTAEKNGKKVFKQC